MTSDEFQAIAESCRRISLAGRSEGYALVERNFNRVLGCHRFYQIAVNAPRTPGQLNLRTAGSEMASEILNWLTATRLFKDRSLSQASTVFGRQSNEFSELKKLFDPQTSTKYEYRLVHWIRNYVQHRSSALDYLQVDGAASEAPTTVAFRLRKSSLLADFKSNRKARADVERLPEEIDVIDLIRQAIPCFRQIFGTVTQQLVRRALPEVSKVQQTAESVPAELGRAHLAERVVSDEPASEPRFAQLINLPLEMTSLLSDQAEREAITSRLISGQTPRAYHTEWPSRLEQSSEFRESLRRGTILLAAYLDDGFTGPEFVAAANRNTEETGEIGSTMESLTLVAAVALFLAGNAIGTTPQDVLGQLLDPRSS
jgi:hypothetical protein